MIPTNQSSMKGFAHRAIVLLVASCGPADSPPSADTDPGQTRGDLPPAAFASLPAEVRSNLDARGCVVPQSYPDSLPHNVARGRFTDSSHVDLAVLCLARDTALILVYRNEGVADVVELAANPESQYREVGDSTVFARAVGVASPEFIRSRHERYGGPALRPIDHDGINDIYVGKASVVWYWHAGRWHQLQGSD